MKFLYQVLCSGSNGSLVALLVNASVVAGVIQTLIAHGLAARFLFIKSR